jgi:hypothetical protein
MPAARASSASAARFTAASSSAFSIFISRFLYYRYSGKQNMAVNLTIH